jgi:Carboxypeptidase regulatory-like domain/TonB-dependent Receptor Plug Domain
MRPHQVIACGSAAMLLAISHPARAQVEVRRATIAGRVHVAGDTMPIAAAEVIIIGRTDPRITDEHGAFRYDGIHPGRYEIRVRRLGYEQIVKFVTVGPGEISNNNWEMHLVPQYLAEVRVHGQMVRVPPYLHEPYRRVAMGFGDYILPDDIARHFAFHTAELLQEIPGAHVTGLGVEFARCDDSQKPFGVGTVSNKIQVYVDGHRATHMMDAAEAMEQVNPADIELIEVYRGVDVIPGEFLEDACAVIAIWTRRG